MRLPAKYRKRNLCIKAFLFGMVSTLIPWSTAFAQDAVDRQALQQALNDVDWMVGHFHQNSGIPGLSLSLGFGDSILLGKGYGKANIDADQPVTNTTRFRMSDVTTLFTATAVMKLASQGNIDLDSDIRRYVPDFPQKRFPVTVRQLLSHTGGVTHFDFNDYNRGKQHIKTLSKALNQFAARPLKYEPGTVYHYSAFGYVLLGLAIEKASGMPYEKYIQDHVLAPLLIVDSYFEPEGNRPENEAAFYNRVERTPSLSAKRDFSYVKPAAGLYGTPAAVVKLLAAYWKGEVIPATEWVKMLRPAPQSRKEEQKLAFDPAMGWRLTRADNQDLFFHMSGKTVGATAAYVSSPRYGLHLSFMANARVESFPQHTLLSLLEPLKSVLKPSANTLNRPEFPCPVGSYEYRGNYNTEFTKGTMILSQADGRCSGTIDTPGQMTNTFLEQGAPTPNKLQLIYLSHTDDIAKFAVVTPIGIFTVPFTGREDGMKGDMIIHNTARWTISAILDTAE